MSAPATPLRLQVIDRIVVVLKAIREGANYFRTAATVERRYTHWREVTKGPAYTAHLDSGGKLIAHMHQSWSDEFHVNIKGVVIQEADAAAEIIKCVRDIRYAIDADSRSTATGSLGNLGAAVFFDEEAETDNGYMSLEGKGQFEQRIRIIVSGNIGEL